MVVTAACVYSPIRVFGTVAVMAAVPFVLFGGLAAASGSWEVVGPLLSLTGAVTILLVMGTGVLVHQLNFLLIGPRREVSPAERALQYMLYFRRLLLSGAALGSSGLAGVTVVAVNSVQDVRISVISVLLLVLGVALVLGGVLVRTIWAVGQKQQALLDDGYGIAAPG